jgi:hypothetical protein
MHTQKAEDQSKTAEPQRRKFTMKRNLSVPALDALKQVQIICMRIECLYAYQYMQNSVIGSIMTNVITSVFFVPLTDNQSAGLHLVYAHYRVQCPDKNAVYVHIDI